MIAANPFNRSLPFPEDRMASAPEATKVRFINAMEERYDSAESVRLMSISVDMTSTSVDVEMLEVKTRLFSVGMVRLFKARRERWRTSPVELEMQIDRT